MAEIAPTDTHSQTQQFTKPLLPLHHNTQSHPSIKSHNLKNSMFQSRWADKAAKQAPIARRRGWRCKLVAVRDWQITYDELQHAKPASPFSHRSRISKSWQWPASAAFLKTSHARSKPPAPSCERRPQTRETFGPAACVGLPGYALPKPCSLL